jgi:3-deoxy-D-manno-octulosonic-acid transferase
VSYFLYNLLLLLLSPVLAVILARRLLAGKSRAGWRERWGHLPEDMACKTAPRLWVHCASVGEVVAATPILKLLRERLPEHEIVLSVITPGGLETAQAAGLARAVFYAPFDIPWAVHRALRIVQPDVLVILETELWPNLLHHARRAGARVILVNGRISDRSFPTYRHLRFLFRWTLGHFDRILVQTERDVERFRQIGGDPARIAVFGNAKFDQAVERQNVEQVAALRRDLKLAEGAPVWVVGSTRLAEEERLVLAAYLQARESLPDLALIHAPRHIERAGEVADMMREAGLNPVRRTEPAGAEGRVSQLILDTFGELAKVYAVGDVAFLGNSLIPPGGGQSLLQPLAQGKPALYGPYVSNFRDIAAQAEAAGVGFPVSGAKELAAHVVSLIRDPERRAVLAERAVALIAANRGAAARYADAIAELAHRVVSRES